MRRINENSPEYKALEAARRVLRDTPVGTTQALQAAQAVTEAMDAFVNAGGSVQLQLDILKKVNVKEVRA